MNSPFVPALFFRTVFHFRLFVTVILLFLTGLLARFPAHNGDLPFYIAAVFSGEGLSDSASLARAAAEIRSSLPASEAAAHLEHLAIAPENFLDFYRMKAGYTGIIRGLHFIGLPYVTATVIPSLLAFFFLGCGVVSWAAKLFPPLAAIFISIILLVVSGAFQLGRMSTPDASSVCLLFWALFRIHSGKNSVLTLFLLFAALLFRPDNLPGIAGLLFVMRWGYPQHPGHSVIRLSVSAVVFSLAAVLAFFILINAWSEPRFWWFRPVPYPGLTDYHDPARLTHFLRLLARGPFPVLFSLAAIVLSCFRRLFRIDQALLLFLAVIFPVRFLLFPYYEARFYTVFYLIGFLILFGGSVSTRRKLIEN